MNNLRKEILGLLEGTAGSRPAALRRSRREDFLYATDLPATASPEAVNDFRRKAENMGWRTEEADGWIQLDRIPAEMPAAVFPGTSGPEARCCAGILRRHPGKRRNGDREKRMLLKAGEEGPEAYERACGILHREWAAALRKGESLPDLTEKCFGEEERKC